MIASKILGLERKTRELNRDIFVAQEARIDFIVDYTIRTIEFRESTDLGEMDVLQTELDLLGNFIADVEQRLVILNNDFETYIQTLENLWKKL